MDGEVSLEVEQNAKGGQAAGSSSGDYSLRENNRNITFTSVTSVYLRHYIGIQVPNLCSKFSFSFFPRQTQSLHVLLPRSADSLFSAGLA